MSRGTRDGANVETAVRLVILLLSLVTYADGDRRLADAVKNQNRAAARALVNQRTPVNVNTAASDGAIALHWAAFGTPVSTPPHLLIRAGARLNAANDHGVTPLSLTCLNGNAAMTAHGATVVRLDQHRRSGETVGQMGLEIVTAPVHRSRFESRVRKLIAESAAFAGVESKARPPLRAARPLPPLRRSIVVS